MYELRPEYQIPAHLATIEHCKTSNEPAFHNMTVGAGKSINIAFMVKHITDKGGRVLVLARQGELIEQNSLDCWEIGCKNSVFSASLNKRSLYYPAVFGTEGTVQRALDNELKDVSFDAIFFDECHMLHWQDCLIEQPESQYGKIIKHFKSKNPKLRIVGYTGSPYRGTEPILNKFWKKQLSDVSTYELINLGYLVPPVFGFGDIDHAYDLSAFNKKSEHEDYSAKELAAMGRAITKDKTKTQVIIEEVINRTRNRLGVLITCASKKHCEQVAECLPEGTWGIITDSTSTKERMRILKDAKIGAIKYVMQIGCLTTGVNVPYWDCCVILRKIGSLTLLIQLTGRVLRTLKNEQIEQGLQKHDALILDYTDTFESMGDIFDNPLVATANSEKAKQLNRESIECPICSTNNSQFAIRCCGADSNSDDGRCEHFFTSVQCGKCFAENAPSSKSCRKCDAVLIDPNSALINKAYSDADYKPVNKMTLSSTKTGGLCVTYDLASVYIKNGVEYPEVAKEYFAPFKGVPYEKARWYKFIEQHIQGDKFRRMVYNFPTIESILNMRAMFDTPTEITHRINEKHFSIINRKKFRSGREELSQ